MECWFGDLAPTVAFSLLKTYTQELHGLFTVFQKKCQVRKELLQSKRFMRALLTSKLCAGVWKTRYESSLSPGNENSKLEMETPKVPAKIDFNFHWKSSSLQTETSDFGPGFLFSFLNSAQPSGWIF